MFEKGKILRKIWICLNNYFDQTSQMVEILTKTSFSPQSEPHTAELYFSVFLKEFLENPQRTSLFSQKLAILEMSKEKLRKLCFFNIFENGKILIKIWISLINCF